MDSLGRMMVVAGLAIAALGAALWLFGRHGGLLPGDIVIERRGLKIFLPVVTCLVASAILSLVAWLIRR